MKASRVRDYVIYIAIALALLGLGFWYVERGGRDLSAAAMKWLGLALNTPILFWYAVRDYRQDWRYPRFWGIVLALLIVHLGLFSIVLMQVDRLGLLWFVLAIPFEIAGVAMVLLRFAYRPINNHP